MVEAGGLPTNGMFHQALLDAMPFSIQVLDRQLNVLYVNKEFTRQLGKSTVGAKCYTIYRHDRGQCLDCPLMEPLLPGDTAPRVIDDILHGRLFRVTHNAVELGDQELILEVFEDVTEQEQAAEALRESEQRFRELVDLLPETVFEADARGLVTFGNAVAYEKFGYTEEDFHRGVNLLDNAAPEERQRMEQNMARVLSGERTMPREYTLIRKDGTRFPAIVCTSRIMKGGQPAGLRGFVIDMTERKRSEMTLVILEERERLEREIAELLHGRIQTRLLVAWHQLGQCEGLLETDRLRASALLAGARKLIDEIREKEIRQASHRLHPSIISLGLAPAVLSLVEGFESHFAVSVSVAPGLAKIDGHLENRIPEHVRLAAYRVVEECLGNVYRHAKASKVNILLDIDHQGRLAVQVQDNGCGFEARSVKSGLGLRAITGRVDQAGGTCQIESSPGKGTKIRALFPICST